MSSAVRTNTGEISCPQCKAKIAVHPEYVQWCQQCDWNLKPEATAPGTLLGIYRQLGQRYTNDLFKKVSHAQGVRAKPGISRSMVLAFFFATLVHLITLATLVLGILVLRSPMPLLIKLMLGGFLLGIAWLNRPRLTPLPDEDECDLLTREQAPALYSLLDAITAELKTTPIDIVVLAADFNAGFTRAGLRRKKVLYLGVPLAAILDSQEQVALYAHEIAHGVNGDPLRGFYIWSAVEALFNWYVMLVPDPLAPEDTRGLIGLLVRPLMFVLANIFKLGGYLLIHLLWRQKQRAEYYADQLAARVSGSAGMIGLLEKLYFSKSFDLALQRVRLKKGEADLLSELQNEIGKVPEHERERLRRLELRYGARLDVTHPPTPYRVKLVQTGAASAPALELDQAAAEQLKQELAGCAERIQQRLRQAFRFS